MDKRVVFYTNEGFFDRETDKYIVARITEDERGYDRWSLHDTIEEAVDHAAKLNGDLGIATEDVLTVVASSMRLTHSDARYEYSVTFSIDGIYERDHHAAAKHVADMLGEDYAQRAVYSVVKAGDPEHFAVEVDLGAEQY